MAVFGFSGISKNNDGGETAAGNGSEGGAAGISFTDSEIPDSGCQFGGGFSYENPCDGAATCPVDSFDVSEAD